MISFTNPKSMVFDSTTETIYGFFWHFNGPRTRCTDGKNCVNFAFLYSRHKSFEFLCGWVQLGTRLAEIQESSLKRKATVGQEANGNSSIAEANWINFSPTNKSLSQQATATCSGRSLIISARSATSPITTRPAQRSRSPTTVFTTRSGG